MMIGPNTTISSVTHPICPRSGRNHISTLNPVIIWNNLWWGANVTVLAAVIIGNTVVIGCGCWVNKDISDDSLSVGVSAKVIKKLEK